MDDSKDSNLYDVIIVGGGPAGMAAAIFAADFKLSHVVLEAAETGGQLVQLYADKPIYDYPSYPEITAVDLARHFIDHLVRRNIEVCKREIVHEIKSLESAFEVVSEKRTLRARSVLLAVGMGRFTPRRLGVEGEEAYTNKGVFHNTTHLDQFKGKSVVVVGGGDTALETTLALQPIAKNVTLVHRSDAFRAVEATQAALKASKVSIRLNTQVQSIQGNDQIMTHVVLKDTVGDDLFEFPTDALILAIGYRVDPKALHQWGVQVERGAIVADPHFMTSRVGVFACGDCIVPAGGYKRIAISVGDAGEAMHSIARYLKLGNSSK